MKKTDYEGWYVLCISILCNVSPEHAFRMYNKDISKAKTRTNKKWTKEDIEAIENYRQQGFSWNEIAAIYSTGVNNLMQNVRYWKRKKSNEHNGK